MRTVSTRMRTLVMGAMTGALLFTLPATATATAMAGGRPTPAGAGLGRSAPIASTAWPKPYFRVDAIPTVTGGPGSYSSAACFNKIGLFKLFTSIYLIDWDNDPAHKIDECLGVGPNRVIYHVWANASGWVPMPNNGLADDTYSPFFYQNTYHTMRVWVAGKGYYCSSLIDTWHPWGPCSGE